MKSKKIPTAIHIAAMHRGDGDDDSTFTQEQLDTAVAAAVSKVTDELKSKSGAEKAELLKDLKKAKDGLKAFDGVDPDKMKLMMTAFENDADLKDIAEGRHEDVIKRRIEKKEAEYTSAIEGLNTKVAELTGNNESLTNKVTELMINNNVVSEFVKEKGLENAIPDIVLRAKAIFKVEGDDVIARDSKGEIITGSKGAMTIPEWVAKLKTEAPHLFPGSSGSGTGGGDGDGDAGGLDAEIKAAIDSGDQKKYQQLRRKQKEQQK